MFYNLEAVASSPRINSTIVLFKVWYYLTVTQSPPTHAGRLLVYHKIILVAVQNWGETEPWLTSLTEMTLAKNTITEHMHATVTGHLTYTGLQ